MANLYTGKDKDRRYRGETVDVTYSAKRCIHAAECVTRLATVFDTKKQPWITPNSDSADAIAAIVTLCPSGALHYERKDGGAAEAVPEQNVITLQEDGPLLLRGDLHITSTGVAIEDETRAALCRCGASQHKPFCDNSHRASGFEAAATGIPAREPEIETAGKGRLTMTAEPNGPIAISGPMEIRDAAGNVIYRGEQAWLCRCGGSSDKPFCDGTHNRNGFQAE